MFLKLNKKIFFICVSILSSNSFAETCSSGGELMFRGCYDTAGELAAAYQTALNHPEWYAYTTTEGCPIGGWGQTSAVCIIQKEYSLGNPDDSPPPHTCGLNPIELSGGSKIQKEMDIDANGEGQIHFGRFYNNTNPTMSALWHYSYENNLVMLGAEKRSLFKKISNPYSSKSEACLRGWDVINVPPFESWMVGATPQFVNDKCQITRNGVLVKELLVFSNIPSALLPPEDTVLLRRNDGSTYIFRKDSSGVYYPLNGELGSLTRTTVDSTAWRYIAANGDIEDYSFVGKLLSITSTNGMKQTLTYNATSGLLSQVQDSTGRKLIFTYTNNLLTSVTTDDNKTTSYTYNASSLIVDVKHPDNTHRKYHYEDARFPTFLTGITDERNVRYATWTYDAQGRAVTSQHAGGAEFGSLTYNADGSTTLTNALNKQTIYRFDDIAGARRVTSVEGQPTTNCVGANQNYTYTPEGWIATKTDWNGNKTTYAYNTKGQEISRVEGFDSAVAKTITTEWHATLNLKTKVTESGKETVYTYDTNGLLLNQNTRSLP